MEINAVENGLEAVPFKTTKCGRKWLETIYFKTAFLCKKLLQNHM